MAFRSTPGGGLAVASDDPTHPIVTPDDTWAIALNNDARWREVKAQVDALAGMSGVGPGDVTDAAIAAILANPGTRTSEGVDARIYQALEENTDGVRPEWFREPSHEDDTASLQAALEAAGGSPVLLASGKTYRVSKALVTTGMDVCLLSDGAAPATVKTSVDATILRVNGRAPSVTATLTGGVSIGSRGWPVPEGGGWVPGMLFTVKSDKLWYHDPRDLAKKSELGLVERASGPLVTTVDPANDGYAPGETVTVSGAAPVRVRVERVRFSGVGVAGQTRRAVHVQGAVSPLVRDVEIDGCPTGGVFFDGCYAPRVESSAIAGTNATTTGYGVQTYGTRHARVVGCIFSGNRRAVDFSGGEVISIDSKAVECTASGGGARSDGLDYGWLPGNGTGAANYGFGSHGPSDKAEYISCTTQGVHVPYSLRGANERVIGCSHFGPTNGGVITLTYGRNLHVSGVRVYALQDGGGKDISLAQGGANINDRRADSLIAVYAGYDHAESTVVVTDTYAELEDAAVRFDPGTVFGGVVHMSGCSFRFATPSGETPAAVFKHSGALAPIGGRWRVGPVGYSRVGGTGGVALTSGVNMEGAQVVNYAASGPTA